MAEDYKELVYFSPGLSASKDHAYNTDKMILSFYYLFSSSLFFYPEICLLLTLLCSFDLNLMHPLGSGALHVFPIWIPILISLHTYFFYTTTCFGLLSKTTQVSSNFIIVRSINM